jgi:hypothetical protein
MMYGLFFIIASLSLSTPAVADSANHLAWIETTLHENRLEVVAHVKAAHTGMLDFELSSVKEGPSGNSQTKQAGSIKLEKGESRALTHLNLSLTGKDHYRLTLRVYKDRQLIAEDRVAYP